MGFFLKLFGKKDKSAQKEDQTNEESTVVLAPKGDSRMEQAYQEARTTFKYFWRELSWEYRRIIPAHSFSCVKVPFSQHFSGRPTPTTEYMWINDIFFDGEQITGTLVNQPNELTNVKVGDSVTIPLDAISDWMFSINGQTYGGFTIQVMRSEMDAASRKAHDDAWGLEFGNYNDVQVVYQQKENPQNLIEHPMCVNSKDNIVQFAKDSSSNINTPDATGYTLLHRDTIAGNKIAVEALLQEGADKNIQTPSGKTALDFAQALNWEHIIPILEN